MNSIINKVSSNQANNLQSFSSSDKPNIFPELESKTINEFAKQNPGVVTTSATSLTSFAFRFMTSPVNQAIEQMFFKKLDFKNAFKMVRANGPYKGALVGSSSAFLGTGSYFGSLEAMASLNSAITGKPVSEARDNLLTKLTAAVVATTLTTPLDCIRIQRQNSAAGTPVNYTAKRLMRGNIPMSGVVIGNFVLGLGLGNNVSETLRPIVKNDNVRELSAKICGVFIGNFLFSPFFNLSRQMKYSHCGIVQGLRNMGYVHDANKYNTTDYTVNSTLRRFIYGMPLNPTTPEGLAQLAIQPHEYVKLNAETFAKNYKMGWKGFATVSPLIFMSCASLAIATQVAKEAVSSPTAPTAPSTPIIEEIN